MMTFSYKKSTFLLTVIFVVAASLIFFLMALTFKHLEHQTESYGKITNSYEVALKLEKLYSNIKDIETERRNYILSGAAKTRLESKTIIDEKIAANTEILKILKSNFKEDPEQLNNLDALQMMILYKYDIVHQTYEGRVQLEDPDSVRETLLAGKNVMASIHDKIHEMRGVEFNSLQERKKDLLFIQKSTPVYFYVIGIFSLCLLVFAFHKINADVKKQLRYNKQLQISLNTSKLAETVGNFGIWTKDVKNNISIYSDNLYRLLGQEPGSFPSNFESFSKHIHPEDQEKVTLASHEMFYNERMSSYRYRAYRKNGELRHFQVDGKSVITENDEKVVLGITTDITQQLKDQLALEDFNHKLTEQNKVLIVANETFGEAEKIGRFGTWQWMIKEDRFNFSDNFIRLFGFEPEVFTGNLNLFLNAVHPEDQKSVRLRITKMYELEEGRTFIMRILRADNEELRYLSVTSRLTKDELNGDYFLIIASDVTEEFLDKKNIQEQNRILAANNKELQAFNYVASHDLQEPLRKIETFISRLREKDFDNLSQTGQKYFERIQFSAGRMRKLIDDLLQFSRSAKVENAFENADLNILFHNAEESINVQILEKDATITKQALPILQVIPFQIQQLFSNILSNSLKYSNPERKLKISIFVEKLMAKDAPDLPLETEQKFWKITFADNGIGFEQEYASRIFELFTRLHGKVEYEGTGIGLAICKKIVENHQGYIFAESKKGVGACFIIYLPII